MYPAGAGPSREKLSQYSVKVFQVLECLYQSMCPPGSYEPVPPRFNPVHESLLMPMKAMMIADIDNERKIDGPRMNIVACSKYYARGQKRLVECEEALAPLPSV